MVGRFEMLEPRVLLAGDVTVALTNGVLRVTGDQLGNVLAVATAADGTMTFTGTATTVNEAAAVLTLTAADVLTITKVQVDMKNGDNTFTWAEALFDVATLESVSVKAGTGADTITMAQVETTGNFSVMAGNGANIITLTTIEAGKNLSVKTGTGADDITVTTGTATAGNYTIMAGNGVNTIDATTPVAGKNVTIKGGKDANTISATNATVAGNMSIKGGKVVDTIVVNTPTVTGNLTIQTQKGADTYNLTAITAEKTTLKASADVVVTAAATGHVTDFTLKGFTNAAPAVTDAEAASLLLLEIGVADIVGADVMDDGAVANAAVNATDTDVEAYAIVSQTVAGTFAINAGTGILTLAAATQGVLTTEHDLVISVTDWAGNETLVDLTITVV